MSPIGLIRFTLDRTRPEVRAGSQGSGFRLPPIDTGPGNDPPALALSGCFRGNCLDRLWRGL